MIYPFIFIIFFIFMLVIIQEGNQKKWERRNRKSRRKNAVWNKKAIQNGTANAKLLKKGESMDGKNRKNDQQ